MRNYIVLLKALLLSTSQLNIYRYCKDSKKRGKITAAFIGRIVLYVMLMGYSMAQCIGYGRMGMASSIPVLCALVISLLSFIFTFFQTNGYLFNFKEYDMLMSLPFKPADVASCKFLYMYSKSLPWYMSVSISMMVVYGIYSKCSAFVYPLWIILSLIQPLIPMLLASFLGFLTARAGSGFKNKKIIQTVFSLGFVLLFFAGRFIIEDILRNNKTADVLQSVSETTDKIAGIYLPARWFSSAVTGTDVISALLLIAVSAVLFVLVFIPVGKSYRKINSALKNNAASGKYVMKEQKSKSLVNSIVFKEFRRMTGSTTYMTNALLGQILSIIMGGAMLIVGFETVIRIFLRETPISMDKLYPAIPFIIYFLIGMMATTAFTPSLEGKNYWIVQSLPITKKTLYQGKMLFNMYLTVPFTLLATAAVSYSAGVPVTGCILFMILGIALCAFSTCWGCVCGIKFMRLDWENEVEVIKQSTAIKMYLFPNMFVTMGLVVGVVILGNIIDYKLITVIMTAAVSVLTLICYARAMALSKK
ncbi:MAG: hypothetical protein J6Z43_05325 [Clostridiales bacterium]|nr:hypothetical protein [Clostridiales bacterium]